MNKIAVVIILIILVMMFLKYLKYSHFNNRSVKICESGDCDHYNVHAGHEDYQDAAFLMKEIRNRTDKLITHLKNKYNIKCSKNETEYIGKRVLQLYDNYDSGNVFEISPNNSSGVTSYSDNKTKLILCMRKKGKKNELHDINTMMFVVIHELAHIMNNRWGHTKSSNFWELFKFLLVGSIEIGIYEPINYAITPILYCGLKITYNPIYYANLTIDNLY